MKQLIVWGIIAMSAFYPYFIVLAIMITIGGM